MAGELVKTKYTDSEISKVSDFLHTAASPIEILQSLFDGAFDDVAASFVVSGLSVSQLATPSMNVQVGAGLAYDRANDKLLHLASPVSVAVSPAHATLDRVDLLEIRFLETDFDQETRAFKDPASGAVSYELVDTKTKIGVEARCLAGAPGASAAPLVEAGWMKLAEISVESGVTAIFNADIRGLTAQVDAENNIAWTVEKSATFSLKSLPTIKAAMLAHIAAEITGVATVHGIRQGSGNGFDADKLDGMHTASAATVSTVVARDADGRAKVAAPASSDDVPTKGYVDTRMPTGSMTMFAGASAPTGWLLCDGSPVSRTTYASMFAIIATTFGEGDGSATFNLPDMREAAPAGAGTRAAGVANHDAFALGEFKDDTLQGHSHVPYPMSARQDYYVDSNLTGGYQDGRLLGNAIARNDMYTDNSHGTPRVSSVTRGKRLGVNFIIKT